MITVQTNTQPPDGTDKIGDAVMRSTTSSSDELGRQRNVHCGNWGTVASG